MRISGDLTDDAVVAELGDRLARLRLGRNMTQAELASEAGIDRKAVARLEGGHGAGVQLSTALRVLRVLGRLEALDGVVPEAGPSPIELREMRGRERRRASGSRRRGGPEDTSGPWQWGDERP